VGCEHVEDLWADLATALDATALDATALDATAADPTPHAQAPHDTNAGDHP
jgi:hypothetical protein